MKNKYPIRAKNETGNVTVDVQEFVVPDSAITAGSGYVNLATATGDVTGPASATNEAATVFDGTTGKTVKDGSAVNVLQKRAVESFTTTATAAGTTTLTVASNPIQVFTGTTTQTVVLPVVTTLPKTGFKFEIINNSTGVLTVNSSGANLVTTIAGGSRATFVAVLLTGTTAASWAFTGNGNAPGIKVYRALLTQSGTDAPVATVLENTLGGTVVWGYNNPGRYVATLASAFTEAKTVILCGTIADTDSFLTGFAATQWVDADSVRVYTFAIADLTTAANALLFNTPVTILVYP